MSGIIVIIYICQRRGNVGKSIESNGKVVQGKLQIKGILIFTPAAKDSPSTGLNSLQASDFAVTVDNGAFDVGESLARLLNVLEGLVNVAEQGLD